MPEGLQLPVQTFTRMTDKPALLEAVASLYPDIPGLSKPADEVVLGKSVKYTRDHALADLFMPEAQLDRILRLLRRKKNLVLQGAPGTGKTFVARRIAYLLIEEADAARAPIIQFHQSMTYEDFVQGYRPDGSGGFAIRNGAFFDFCENARKQPGRPFVFIVDEINRGNVSKIFGELLMLLEHDKRDRKEFAVRLAYSESHAGTFSVPPNVFLIGTMNTADRSLSMVDYALRRRFAFVTLEPGFSSPLFAKVLKDRGANDELVKEVRHRMTALNEMILNDTASLGRGYQIGHSFFVPEPGQIVNPEWMEEIIECEIIPLLEEYWCDNLQDLEDACKIARGQR
jgi:MoxR-like ATPase